MIIATYTLGCKLQNKIAIIHRQDWDVTSTRFLKYYLDISGTFRSENNIHNFHCEKTSNEIENWLRKHEYIKVDCKSCENSYYKNDVFKCSAGRECTPKYS